MAVIGIEGNSSHNGLFTDVLYYLVTEAGGKQTIEIAFKEIRDVQRFPLDKEDCITVFEK